MNGQTLNWITDLFHHVNDDRVVSLSSKYIHLDYAQSFLMESTKLISNGKLLLTNGNMQNSFVWYHIYYEWKWEVNQGQQVSANLN